MATVQCAYENNVWGVVLRVRVVDHGESVPTEQRLGVAHRHYTPHHDRHPAKHTQP